MIGEIVLVTGGSGFLGQHIVRELQERDPRVAEIRVLDLQPYSNRLGHSLNKPVVSVVGDVCDVAACRSAFAGVSCVFHCAALASYDYPADADALHRNNVTGTQNVIQLCVEQGVPRLVFTSCAQVTLVPYMRPRFFCAVVNKTEAKVPPPDSPADLLFPQLAGSKLRAERLVCQADGTTLQAGGGVVLRTVCLRPTLLYGEEDRGLLLRLMRVADACEGTFPQLSGSGGKHQLCYAGNAGWAHVLAKDALLDRPDDIAGLPIFITDDSPITDLTRMCCHLTRPAGERSLYRASRWLLPPLVSYLAALLVEPLAAALLPLPLPVRPSSAVALVGSIVLYNRLRADTHLRYSPIYRYEAVVKSVVKYYSEEARVRECSRKLN